MVQGRASQARSYGACAFRFPVGGRPRTIGALVMKLRAPLASLAPVALAALALGCNDLNRYSTAPSESYCGSVTLSSAFRAGLSPRVQMRVQLDAAELDTEQSPGVVWTFEAGARDEPTHRLLNRAPLRRIPKIESDPIAALDLGGGRDHTRIFAVTPSDAEEDPLLAILSLRSDDGIEVRLLRPGLGGTGTKAPPTGKRPIFGVFTLTKQIGTCGF